MGMKFITVSFSSSCQTSSVATVDLNEDRPRLVLRDWTPLQ